MYTLIHIHLNVLVNAKNVRKHRKRFLPVIICGEGLEEQWEDMDFILLT